MKAGVERETQKGAVEEKKTKKTERLKERAA